MAENVEWKAQHLFAGAVRALIVVVLLAAALSPAQASPADAQRALPPHAAIVELFTIGEQAFAVVVRPESTRVVPLSTSVTAISHSAETLRRALVQNEMARDAAATLYALIFRPRDGDDAAEALRKTALFDLEAGRIAPLSIRLLVVGGSRALVR